MKKISKKKMTRFSMAILILVSVCWVGTAAAYYQFSLSTVNLPYIPPNAVLAYYPDLAAGLDFKVSDKGLFAGINQFSGNFEIIGEVKNISPKHFNYGGYIRLYRGTKKVAEKSFGAMAWGSSIKLVHQTVEDYKPPKGTAKPDASSHPDYILKIEYNSGINAQTKEIDQNLNNNEAHLVQQKMANTLYWQMTNRFRYKILQDLNKYRLSKGLGVLTLDPALIRTAQENSEWMKKYDNLEHRYGNAIPENISTAGFNCVFGSWINSSGHNKMMLNPNWTKVGIGICGSYVSAIFG